MSVAMFDNSPERRNLNALSVSIILFHLAEGKFVEGQLKLSMLNVEFAKSEVLVYSIHIFLLWFLFRYWVAERDIATQNFRQEVSKINLTDLYVHIIDKDYKGSFHLYLPDEPYDLDVTPSVKKIKGVWGFIFYAYIYIWMAISRPTLSAYYVSYFLAFTALVVLHPVYLAFILSMVFMWILFFFSE